jgi:peptidoglycan/LPS O-acetylase OafA/YrhL
VRLLRGGALLPLLVGMEAAVIGGRWWWVAVNGASAAVDWSTLTRMDGLLMGAIAAVVVRRYTIPPMLVKALPWICVGDLIFFGALFDTRNGAALEMAGIPILATLFAGIVLYAAVTEGQAVWPQRLLCWTPLRRVGKYAYGIYVYHPVIFYFRAELSGVWRVAWFSYASAAAVVYLVALVSYEYFEAWFLGFKDRFAPRYGMRG